MLGRHTTTAPVDFAFLERQTFGDASLAREVLCLFRDQSAELVPTLPGLPSGRQAEVAHLLKGSCQGIGAARAADLLQHYGDADAARRRALQPEIEAAFAAAAAAIRAYLAAT